MSCPLVRKITLRFALLVAGPLACDGGAVRQEEARDPGVAAWTPSPSTAWDREGEHALRRDGETPEPAHPADSGPRSSAAELSLAGEWAVRLDEDDRGLDERWYSEPLDSVDVVRLPGSLAESGVGHRFVEETGRYEGLPNPPYLRWPAAGYSDAHRRDELGTLVSERMTYGPVWLERLIELPAQASGRSLRLELERVKWSSRVWIDGEPAVGAGTRSLHTPHEYALGPLEPGPHRVTLRLDNRPQVDIGIAGHGYGMETEPLWIGVVGSLRLVALAPQRVELLDAAPLDDDRGARLELTVSSDGPLPADARLELRLLELPGRREVARTERELLPSDLTRPSSWRLRADERLQLWDEFTPILYEVRWSLSMGGRPLDEDTARIGLRRVERRGRSILVNGEPVFLRGGIDCAIHPDSHTPPTHRAWWERVLGIHRRAGFNHLRFHTWCPPEAAFDVADELGLYLQVETAYWVDDWIAGTPPEPAPIGSDAEVDGWVEEESRRILRRYALHPSFVLFCIGNEFGMSQTDWRRVEDIVERLGAATDHTLVTGACARKSLDADEFWVTHRTTAAARGIGPRHTDWDFDAAVRGTEKPLIAHETGQRPSWPDYDALLPRYRGVQRPWNLERLRTRAEAAGCSDHRRRAEASARFALVQYKSEHEALRRTPGITGYQLLMLHDFTGQGEAHVGLLDAFHVEKPGIDLEAIRSWNGPTVPLARFARYTWSSEEALRAELLVAHEGPEILIGVEPRWQLLTGDGRELAAAVLPARTVPDHALTRLGALTFSLESIPAPAALRLRLTVGSASNEWPVWVYPPPRPAATTETAPETVLVTRELDDLAQTRLEQGGRVLLLAHGSVLPDARAMSWATTYWTGAWSHGGGLGLLVAAHHPALARFPTATHSDWQWRDLVDGAMAVRLPAAVADRAAIVEPIADFHHPERSSSLFELRVGDGRLLVSGFDLTTDLDRRHEARALRASLLAYAGSESFEPRADISIAEAKGLVGAIRFGPGEIHAITADAAHPGHGPENVLDGDPATFWHTPWGAQDPGPPHHLTLDLGRPRTLVRLRLLPRQDSSNGRFREVAVRVPADGESWSAPIAIVTLEDTNRVQTVELPPRRSRHVRVEIRSEVAGRPWSSLAELSVESQD